jgi:hypothetical protein
VFSEVVAPVSGVLRLLALNPRVLRLADSSASQAQSNSDQDQPRAHLPSVTSRRVHCINGRTAAAALTMFEREANAAALHGDRLQSSVATINIPMEDNKCSIEGVFSATRAERR